MRIAAICVLIALIVGCSAFSGVNILADENARVIEKARVIMNGTRLRSEQPPQVVSVQKLSFEQARRELPASVSDNSDLASNSSVWLVIFKGQWQALPPDPSHTITPAPPTEECVFVLMDANENGLQAGGPSICTAPSTMLQTASFAALPSPALGDRPPVVTARYAGQEQHGVLGTYCWNGCADTLFFIPSQPIMVPVAAKLQFKISERYPPHHLVVTFFPVGTNQRVAWSDPSVLALGARNEITRALPVPAMQFEVQMPDQPGDYALNLFADWLTGDNYGPDASFGYHIIVNNSAR